MCVAVIGGMDRLESHYVSVARRAGVLLEVFPRMEANLAAKLKRFDALVIFTNKVSHGARNEAMSVARETGVPVFQLHSCGVCTLRNCLGCLVGRESEA